MQVVFGKGKKSKHGFMPFGNILPSGTEVPLHIKKYMCEKRIRFCKWENTLKAILRKIKKQNYEKGTTIYVPSWYIGHADLYVIV